MAEDIDMMSFAYYSLSQIVLNFFTLFNPFSPQILPQSDPPPVDLSIWDIRWQIG